MAPRVGVFAAAGLGLLGVLHLGVGLYWAASRPLPRAHLVIGELPAEAFVWLVGGGLVFLFTALVNIMVWAHPGPPFWYRASQHAGNLLVTVFLLVLAALDPRPMGNAGVFLALACAVLVTVAAALAGRVGVKAQGV